MKFKTFSLLCFAGMLPFCWGCSTFSSHESEYFSAEDGGSGSLNLVASTALGTPLNAVKILSESLSGQETSVIPELIQILESTDSRLRSRARYQLKAFGADAVSSLVSALTRPQTTYETGMEIGLTLGLIGEPAVEALTETLSHENWRIRYISAEALSDIGELALKAIPRLIKTVEDTNKFVRRASLKALGNMGSAASQVHPILKKTLRAGDAHASLAAAEALLNSGESQEASTVLVQFLTTHENNRVRLQALQTIRESKSRTPEMIQSISLALRDKDSDVRQAATSFLQELRS
jgi:HEAT repeat protein